MPQAFKIRKLSLVAMAAFLWASEAHSQGLYESTDRMARDELADSLLLHDGQPLFFGFRPTSFERPTLFSSETRAGQSVFSENKSWGLGRLSFASVHETRQRIRFIGSDAYPVYQSLSRERAEGLEVPRGESLWAQAEIGARPSDWFYLHGSFHGGLTVSHLQNSGREALPGWYHPESLFAEARLNSFVFSIGRKPIFWGQADSGPLVLSDNATSFDGIQISTLSQRWPWIFKYLGQLKAEMFLARNSNDRENPHDWFTGIRLGTTPFDLFEMNASFVYQAGGDRAKSASITDTLVEVLGGRVETGAGDDDVSSVTNRSVSLDFRVNLSDLEWPTTFYWENYLEDCCGSVTDIIKKSYGYAFGVYTLTSALPVAHKMRIEYVRIPNSAYFNGDRVDGWSNEGALIGNPVGRDSERLKLSWKKLFASIDTTFHLEALWQRRLRTGELVRSDIRASFSDFDIETAWGGLAGWSTSITKHLTVDGRLLYARFQNRDNLRGHSTNEWSGLTRMEYRF